MTALKAAIAVTRFGLGAHPGEIERILPDPQAWLTGQIAHVPVPEGMAGSKEGLIAFDIEYRARLRDLSQSDRPDAERRRERLRRTWQDRFAAQIQARNALALATPSSFSERWVRFWSNHFSVSADSRVMEVLAPTLELEAIRPNAFGHFSDMLIAAETHPAMLVYLDQVDSYGPNSPAGRRHERGLNENLAREILELHTIGVEAGFDQQDVLALARILTGWVVRRARPDAIEERAGEAVFQPARHEPGAKYLLTRRFEQAGAQETRTALSFLADRPQTARRLSEKLARHFLADAPQEEDIAHIEQAWTRSRGDLAVVARALVTAPGAFTPEAEKFKTPQGYLISTLRALEIDRIGAQTLMRMLTVLGQPPFGAPSPQGWPDDADYWAGPDALLKRLEFSNTLSRRWGEQRDARSLAGEVLGARLGAQSREAIDLAASREQALTLLLMSPEFLRR